MLCAGVAGDCTVTVKLLEKRSDESSLSLTVEASAPAVGGRHDDDDDGGAWEGNSVANNVNAWVAATAAGTSLGSGDIERFTSPVVTYADVATNGGDDDDDDGDDNSFKADFHEDDDDDNGDDD